MHTRVEANIGGGAVTLENVCVVSPLTFCQKEVARAAIFKLPFSLELALALSSLLNCRHCGRCCREPKRTFVADEDIERISEFIDQSFLVVRRMMHIDSENLMHPPCPFYEHDRDKKCGIEPVKPISCKIFPLFRVIVKEQPDKPRIGCSLHCEAAIELHNLLSMEKL